MSKIQTLPDGSTVVYLDADWRPVSVEKAVYVKVIRPDGRVEFGVVVNASARG